MTSSITRCEFIGSPSGAVARSSVRGKGEITGPEAVGVRGDGIQVTYRCSDITNNNSDLPPKALSIRYVSNNHAVGLDIRWDESQRATDGDSELRKSCDGFLNELKILETKFKVGLRGMDSSSDVVINRLWEDPNNRTIVDAFMNNKLCTEAALGEDKAITAFKQYAVQNYFYLVDWFKFRVLRLAKQPHDDFLLAGLQAEAKSVEDSLEKFIVAWRLSCIEDLDLGPADFHVERAISAVAYAQFLQNTAHQDIWYNLYIVLIGCYWGWSKLALKLHNESTTNKKTCFYKHWIEPNINSKVKPAAMAEPGKALSHLLDNYRAGFSSHDSNERAKDLFRTSLRLEVALFNSAYEKPIPRPGPAPHEFPPRPSADPVASMLDQERSLSALLAMCTPTAGVPHFRPVE